MLQHVIATRCILKLMDLLSECVKTAVGPACQLCAVFRVTLSYSNNSTSFELSTSSSYTLSLYKCASIIYSLCINGKNHSMIYKRQFNQLNLIYRIYIYTMYSTCKEKCKILIFVFSHKLDFEIAWSIGSGEDSLSIYHIYRHGGHLGHVTWIIHVHICSPFDICILTT